MIDPRNPDFADTPASLSRPGFAYRPGGAAGSPAVSVVTPFFNAGMEFEQTAACILGQSLQNFEWIIVNDGSTDTEALALLGRWRAADPRVRVIDHPANRGLAAARNTGFRAAASPYVFQLDADDLVEPTTLEKCLWFLDSNTEYALAKGFTVGFGDQRYLWTRGFEDGPAILRENPLTATAMIRRSAFRAVGGYDESLRDGLEDWDFWLRCAERGLWGGTIPEFLDWYRRREPAPGRWADLHDPRRLEEVRRRTLRACPRLRRGRFPAPRPVGDDAAPVRTDALFTNPLSKGGPRLLMIVPWLALGGSDRFNLDLIRMLGQRGWEVSVATTMPGDHSWLPEFSRLTPDVFPMHHFLRPRDMPAFLRALIESRRPDAVLVSNSALGYALLPFLRAACPGPAWVDYCHMEEEWGGGGFPAMSVAAGPALDLRIVASGHLRNWMVARGADPSRIEVCRIHVDSGVWTPDERARERIRAELDLSPADNVMLYAARLCPQKQPRVLAETARLLARRGASFRLLVAGDGPDLPWLERFIREQGLSEHVRLLGALPPDRMPALMAAADIFFLPSRWEGIALSIYEAMSAGLAVVGTDVGGQRELVTPGTGVLLAPGDEQAMPERYAAELLRLLADPSLRVSLGRSARRRVEEHFTLAEMGDRMAALLRGAAASDRAPRAELDADVARRAMREACAAWGPGRRRWLALQRAGAAADPGRTLEALARIENSRAWRAVEFGRRALRLGRAPAGEPETPAQRLARIQASRAYRLIGAAKRTGPYRLYARRRYGPGVA